MLETLTRSETVCRSWFDAEYALAEMVCIPLATIVEFQVKVVDDVDAIKLPSIRKATFLTVCLIRTEVVTKLATVESGTGEAIVIGLAYARP